MTLYGIHTLSEPVRYFQQYEDPVFAQRMADHYASVLHEPLVVEPIEDPEPATVYRIVATRRTRRQVESLDAARSDPDDLPAAMRTWQALLPGWTLRAIPQSFMGPATSYETPASPGR